MPGDNPRLLEALSCEKTKFNIPYFYPTGKILPQLEGVPRKRLRLP